MSASKKFKWTVEIEIDEIWVADGFDLTDERAHDIMTSHLGCARSDEISVRVTKRPSMFEVNKAQGAPYQKQREEWPRPNAHMQRPLFTVTRTDDDDGRANYGRARIYGVPQNMNGSRSHHVDPKGTERYIGIEPDEYVIEVGDTVYSDERVARCVDFASVKYYDARAREEPETCKACETRKRKGLEGQCPSCANERSKKPRYNVSPSDDGNSIEDQERSRSWDVIDRVTGGVVENHLTRTKAREAAKELNLADRALVEAKRIADVLEKTSAVSTTNANAGGDRPSQ